MASRMTERLHFLPVDLQVHRSQVFDLMVGYYEGVAKEAWDHDRIDLLASTGFSSVQNT